MNPNDKQIMNLLTYFLSEEIANGAGIDKDTINLLVKFITLWIQRILFYLPNHVISLNRHVVLISPKGISDMLMALETPAPVLLYPIEHLQSIVRKMGIKVPVQVVERLAFYTQTLLYELNDLTNKECDSHTICPLSIFLAVSRDDDFLQLAKNLSWDVTLPSGGLSVNIIKKTCTHYSVTGATNFFRLLSRHFDKKIVGILTLASRLCKYNDRIKIIPSDILLAYEIKNC